jgi:fumarylacetoacetase
LPPFRLSASNARYFYRTVGQLVAHHTCGGCDLRPGDLLGTGTISGLDRASCGSLLELTLGGREPVRLDSGEERRYIEDGDEIVMRATASRDGYATIGFGECRAMIQPALK